MAQITLKSELSDNYTNDKEKEIEKRLKEIYRKAWKELKEKETAYFKDFEEWDKVKAKEVDDGVITKEEYQTWRINRINADKRWKSLCDKMAKKITETNQIASDYVNDKTPEIYSFNYNYEGFQAEQVTNINFTIVNEDTIKEAVKNPHNSTEFKTLSINPKRDYNWNVEKINTALISGIVQGKSAQDIAKDFYKVMGNNMSSAIRNARTSITSAQNAGRQKGREQLENEAKKYGWKLRKQWVSTHDSRTRDSHVRLDGEIVDINDKFSNGLLYPADKDGIPNEVYNCRCTSITIIDGINDNFYKPEVYNDFNFYDIGNDINNAIDYFRLRIKANKINKSNSDLLRNFVNDKANSNNEIKNIINKYYKKPYYCVDGVYENYFIHNVIHLYSKTETSSVCHELFHFIDYQNNKISDKLTKYINEDKKILYNLGWNETQIVNTLEAIFSDSFDKKTGFLKKEYFPISDILNGMSNGKIKIGGYHEKEYWKTKNILNKEIFAEYGAVYFNNNLNVIYMFENLFPNITKGLKKIIGEIK